MPPDVNGACLPHRSMRGMNRSPALYSAASWYVGILASGDVTVSMRCIAVLVAERRFITLVSKAKNKPGWQLGHRAPFQPTPAKLLVVAGRTALRAAGATCVQTFPQSVFPAVGSAGRVLQCVC